MSERTPGTTGWRVAGRVIDEMLAAQSRFAQAWRDNMPLTEQQKADAKTRDDCRSLLIEMIEGRPHD